MDVLNTTDYMEVVIYTFAIIGVVIINSLLFLRAKKIILVQYFFRIQALVGFWMVAKIFKIIAPDAESIWLWVIIEYFGICYFSVEFLVFAHIYKFGERMNSRLHILLASIATINYLVLFTNEYHHLFYKEVLLIHSIKGPYFYVHTLYSYSLIVIAIILLVSSKANIQFSIKEKIILLIGLCVPLFVNINYITNTIGIPYDLTPISLNIMILSFGFAAFRSNHYDMQMMTRLKILDNLYEGIIILDKDNRIIEYNKKMFELTSPIVNIKKYSSFETIFKKFDSFIENYDETINMYKKFIKSAMSEVKSEIVIDIDNIKSYFIFALQKTYSIHGEFTGSIIKFVDISEYHTLMEQLGNKNCELEEINNRLNENISVKKRLVVEQERNRASKEVHDILGHSVTLVISLLEMIKATYSKEPIFAKEKISQAMDITRKGLNELKQSLTKKKNSSINTETLVDDLEQLTDEFTLSGVDVEFITNHYPVKIKPNYYDTIYRICQESMTNALKHGHAKKITIAVRFSEYSVDIIIADNGVGCEVFTKGNGIKGMEQRVRELDGFFSCGSPDGEGFNLHVTIPITRELTNINEVEII